MDKVKAILRQSTASLRNRWWRLRLQTLGAAADIQPGACFEYPDNIALGDGCRVARQAILRANTSRRPGIRLGDAVNVQENVLINANRGDVVIGDGSWIGPCTVIYGNGDVRIGRDVMIANHCAINTVSHHASRLDIPMKHQGVYCDPVHIEDDVWIGAGAMILQGVRVGRGSIVGAGAVVTRDLPPWSVAVGVPARVTGSRLDTPESDSVGLEARAAAAMEGAACL